MLLSKPVTIERVSKTQPSEGGPVARVLAKLAADRETFRERVAVSEFYRLLWVKFKIIDGCNIKCVMCNHWRREEYLRSFLTEERLLSLGQELSDLGTRHVNWSGGEPTLRKELPRIIGHYQTLGIASSIVSNGTRLTKDYADEMCQAGLKAAYISLESAVPAIHDRVVGSGGAWRKLIDGVEYLRLAESPPAVSFQTVLTSINLGPELPAMVPLAARLGVARVALMPVYVRHLSREEKLLLPSAAQLERLRTEYLPEMLQAGARLGVEVQVDGGDTDDIEPMSTVTEIHAPRISAGGDHSRGYYLRHACYLPWYHCTIDHRGDVFACCHMRNEDGLMGNITDSSLCDILQSDVARGLRERLKTDDVPPSCQECSMQISENQAIDRMLQD